jgi:hypothetical protein
MRLLCEKHLLNGDIASIAIAVHHRRAATWISPDPSTAIEEKNFQTPILQRC